MSELGLPEFVANDPSPARCKSCGVPFVGHLGLQGTCATVERVRALLAAWQAAVTVCEHSFGPASHLGKMMIDQLQAALDGKGE